MKLTTFLAAAAFATASMARQKSLSDENKEYHKVHLPPPLDWVAGRRLFPKDVIAGYNAEVEQYPDAEAWAEYVLKQCKEFEACTSTLSYQAENSGSTHGRFWFGYVFRGGATTAADYRREEGVTGSIAYSENWEDQHHIEEI